MCPFAAEIIRGGGVNVYETEQTDMANVLFCVFGASFFCYSYSGEDSTIHGHNKCKASQKKGRTKTKLYPPKNLSAKKMICYTLMKVTYFVGQSA